MQATVKWMIATCVFILIPQATQAQLIRTLSSQNQYENKAGFDSVRFSDGHLIATGDSQLSCWSISDWEETHRLFENPSWDEGIIPGSAVMNSGQLSFLERDRNYAPMLRTVATDGHEQQPPTRLFPDGLELRCSTNSARSADGKVLAIQSRDDSEKIWVLDIESQQVLAEFNVEAGCMALSPDGSRLVVGRDSDEPNAIQLFDTLSQTKLASTKGFADRIKQVAISPDGRTVISAGNYGGQFGLTFWDANSLRTSPADHLTEDEIGLTDDTDFDRDCNGIAVWTDGSLVAAASNDAIFVIDIESRKPVTELRGMRNIDDVSVSSDGNWLASLDGDRIGIWRWKDALKTTQPTRSIPTHRPGDFRPIVRFSPDGKSLAFTCSPEDKGKDVGGGELGAVAAAAADDAAFDTSDENRTGPLILLVDPQSGRLQKRLSLASHQKLRLTEEKIERLEILHDDYFTAMEFSPDGREVLATNNSGYNLLLSWTIGNQELDRIVELPREGVDIDFSPIEKRRYVSTEYSTFVAEPQGNTWELSKVSDEYAQSSGFSMDGNHFLRGLRQYSIADLSHPLVSNDGSVSKYASGLAATYEGRYVFAFNGAKLIRWTLDEGLTETPFAFHSGENSRSQITDIGVSPTASLIAVAGKDGRIRVWDYSNNELVTTLVGHEARVNSLSFSPDGNQLASTASDGTTCLWDFQALGQGRTATQIVHTQLPANRQFQASNGGIVKVIFDRSASPEEFKAAIQEALRQSDDLED